MLSKLNKGSTMPQTNKEYREEEKRDNFDDTYSMLSSVLHNLCLLTNRQITIFLPTKKNEIIPYMKKEIIKTLELIK
jgi:hypothetical protein